MSPKGAVVMNIVLRSIYVVLLLASLPLALWPIHDSLGMTLGTPPLPPPSPSPIAPPPPPPAYPPYGFAWYL